MEQLDAVHPLFHDKKTSGGGEKGYPGRKRRRKGVDARRRSGEDDERADEKEKAHRPCPPAEEALEQTAEGAVPPSRAEQQKKAAEEQKRQKKKDGQKRPAAEKTDEFPSRNEPRADHRADEGERCFENLLHTDIYENGGAIMPRRIVLIGFFMFYAASPPFPFSPSAAI